MKKNQMFFRRALALLLTLAMAVSQLAMFAAAEPADTSATTYVAFTSDVHGHPDNNQAVARLKNWLPAVSNTLGGATLDMLGVCGDMAWAGGTISEDNYWAGVGQLMTAVDESGLVNRTVFTTGNHEISGPGYYKKYTTYTDAVRSRITQVGDPFVGNEPEKYQVFCFGASGVDNVSGQGFSNTDIQLLQAYLQNCDTSKPVFVLSHYPLHSYGSRSTSNADVVIEILNNYHNVIFLWGHNHTESDAHYDKVYTNKLDSTAINFIYAAAGCMSDGEYSVGSQSVGGKGLVVGIDGDETITMAYYDADGNALNSWEVDITTGKAVGSQSEELPENDPADTYTKVTTLVDGATYVITADGYGMTTELDEGYINSNNYGYSGFKGYAVMDEAGLLVKGVKPGMLWTAEKVSGGWAFKNAEGKYLSSSYASNGNGGSDGKIFLGDTAEAWTVSNGTLKGAGSNKSLTWDDGVTNLSSGACDLFTVRSTGDTIEFYQKGTVVENVEAVDGDYVAVTEFKNGAKYIISAANMALGNTTHNGYVNSTGYAYSGMNGVALPQGSYVSASYATANPETVWTAEKVSGGWAFKNDATGKYLIAYYGNHEAFGTTYKGGYIAVGGEADVWTLDGGKLKHNTSAKYLTWETDSDVSNGYMKDGDDNIGSADFFSIRSSCNDTFTFYECKGTGTEAPVDPVVTVDKLEHGKWYILSVDGNAMTAEEHSGYTNTSNYTYSGLRGEEFSTVTPDMLWQAERVLGGYAFKTKDGLYLNASYGVKGQGGYIFLSENPMGWLYSNGILYTVVENDKKVYLNWDATSDVSGSIASGEANLFTIRSGSEKLTISKADDGLVEKLENGDYEVVEYVAGENGHVTRAKELLIEGYDSMELLRGSKAQANKGYHFVKWVNESNTTVSTEESYKTNVPGTYTAIFEENAAVTITYKAGEFGQVQLGGDGDLAAQVSENPKPVTGSPVGALAVANQDYRFVKWVNAAGDTVCDTALFVPGKDSAEGLYVTAEYTAIFEKIPECMGEGEVALVKDGTYNLVFNGVSAGRYIVNHVADCWTIRDTVTGQYVAMVNGSVVMRDQMYHWNYDGGFYATGRYELVERYLNVNASGKFTVSLKAVDVAVLEQFEYAEHKMVVTDRNNGTHTKSCAVCGLHVNEEHVYEEGVCICGAEELKGTVKVSVNVTSSVTRVALVIRRTMYTANIKVTAENMQVAKLEYSMDNGSWVNVSNTSNPSVTVSHAINNLRVRVTDEHGRVTIWKYNGSTTVQQ